MSNPQLHIVKDLRGELLTALAGCDLKPDEDYTNGWHGICPVCCELSLDVFLNRAGDGISRFGCTNGCEDGWIIDEVGLRQLFPAKPAKPKTEPKSIEAVPISLDKCHEVFRRWLGDEYDLDVLDVMLCALAAERLDGDPLWLLIISGPGAAKTETAQASAGAGAVVESTVTGEAALLSGTPKKDQAKNATGGLLRRIGERGVLIIKDFTSILSMNRDRRAEVLAALREVHDGYWSRSIGAEGGKTLTWQGRLVIICAVTTAWDSAHSVVSAMGDRFVSIRLDSEASRSRLAAGRRTMANTGNEDAMRAELSEAVGGVIAGMDPSADLDVTEAEGERLLFAADLVTLARTAVEYDYKGNVIDAHAPEMPTRFLRQLQQIVRGGLALGMDREGVMRLAIRAARDSMPKIRLEIIDDLAEHGEATPSDIRRRLDLPWTTIDRQCQALNMLGVLNVEEREYGDRGRVRWHYSLAPGINPEALQTSPDLSFPLFGCIEKSDDTSKGGLSISGEHDDDDPLPPWE